MWINGSHQNSPKWEISWRWKRCSLSPTVTTAFRDNVTLNGGLHLRRDLRWQHQHEHVCEEKYEIETECWPLASDGSGGGGNDVTNGGETYAISVFFLWGCKDYDKKQTSANGSHSLWMQVFLILYNWCVIRLFLILHTYCTTNIIRLYIWFEEKSGNNWLKYCCNRRITGESDNKSKIAEQHREGACGECGKNKTKLYYYIGLVYHINDNSYL